MAISNTRRSGPEPAEHGRVIGSRHAAVRADDCFSSPQRHGERGQLSAGKCASDSIMLGRCGVLFDRLHPGHVQASPQKAVQAALMLVASRGDWRARPGRTALGRPGGNQRPKSLEPVPKCLDTAWNRPPTFLGLVPPTLSGLEGETPKSQRLLGPWQ